MYFYESVRNVVCSFKWSLERNIFYDTSNSFQIDLKIKAHASLIVFQLKDDPLC